MPASLLSLQRTYGNRFVQRLVDGRVLQRKCTCGGTGADCQEELALQRRSSSQAEPSGVPPIVYEVLRSPGQPLDAATRAFMESRFASDFGEVRVHTDARAAESAQIVNALAYTIGHDLVFGAAQYAPRTSEGQRVLAHELTHVIQQSQTLPASQGISLTTRAETRDQEAELEANRAAADLTADGLSGVPSPTASVSVMLQRQAHGTPPVSVRSPAFEEFVTQVSTVEAGLTGRPLTDPQIAFARPVFGRSIDYSRVRLIPSEILEYRTVGNTIRVPRNFTVLNKVMAETFIHEMTHVWEYQHGGTSYISVSLATQIAGTVRTGMRNAAYCYTPTPGKSFFEYMPEQQAMIVENYFKMVRDRASQDKAGSFDSNYDWVCFGKPVSLSWPERQKEISSELPLHEPLIAQMQAAVPQPEAEILTQRATEVMRGPSEELLPGHMERGLAQVKPVLEIRF